MFCFLWNRNYVCKINLTNRFSKEIAGFFFYVFVNIEINKWNKEWSRRRFSFANSIAVFKSIIHKQYLIVERASWRLFLWFLDLILEICNKRGKRELENSSKLFVLFNFNLNITKKTLTNRRKERVYVYSGEFSNKLSSKGKEKRLKLDGNVIKQSIVIKTRIISFWEKDK